MKKLKNVLLTIFVLGSFEFLFLNYLFMWIKIF